MIIVPCRGREMLICTREPLKNVTQWPRSPIPQFSVTQSLTRKLSQQLTGHSLRESDTVAAEPFPLVIEIGNLGVSEALHFSKGSQFVECEPLAQHRV